MTLLIRKSIMNYYTTCIRFVFGFHRLLVQATSVEGMDFSFSFSANLSLLNVIIERRF